jgi:Cd2+/Zn2+-exporting ATPase
MMLTRLSSVFDPQIQLRAAVVAGALLLTGFVLSDTVGDGGRYAYWLALAIGLVYGVEAAVSSLRKATFDIDVLMAVAAILATYVGHPEEGAMLLFLFVLAGALEDLAMERTRREVEALQALVPESAVVLREGSWISISPDQLAANDTIRIRPGERTPADCRIVAGESAFDQSAITGESMPREVKVGDELFAGTINNDDPVDAVVLRPSSESSVQRILKLVTEAQSQRAPLQQLIDRLGQPYSLAVTGLSVLVVLFWWLVLKTPLAGTQETQGALYVGITVLIVASPCALVIATPTATLAAISRAARGGVLFKGGQSVQRLAAISALCLDKTGTLTYGRPRLYQVHPVAWSNGSELLAIAAGLEQDSTHPIAGAIRDAAASRGVEPVTLADIDHVTARGIEGRWQGRPVRLGRYSFVEPLIPVCFRNRVREVLEKIQDRGHVAVTVAAQGPTEDAGQAAVLIMADSVRPGAHELVQSLHALGIRPVRMLTGDNALTARKVASALKLDSFDADLLPEQKLEIINAMRAGPPAIKVGIIGDGVNDAPALAAADASIAIGGIGAAAALESADSVLMTDDLSAVPWVITLARRTKRIIIFNLVFALSVIALMVVATLVGAAVGRPVPLSLGVLAHEGGTILVVLNSLRLLRMPGFVVASAEAANQGEPSAHARTARG